MKPGQSYIVPVGFAATEDSVLVRDGGCATELEARDVWSGASQFSPERAAQWLRPAGGCCRVRPVDVAGIAASVK